MRSCTECAAEKRLDVERGPWGARSTPRLRGGRTSGPADTVRKDGEYKVGGEGGPGDSEREAEELEEENCRECVGHVHGGGIPEDPGILPPELPRWSWPLEDFLFLVSLSLILIFFYIS